MLSSPSLSQTHPHSHSTPTSSQRKKLGLFFLLTFTLISLCVYFVFVQSNSSTPSPSQIGTFSTSQKQQQRPNKMKKIKHNEKDASTLQSWYDKNLPTFDIATENFQQQQSSSSICSGLISTADGLWGLNNPHYNSMDWYRELDEEDFYENWKRNDNIGKWYFGPRKFRKRLYYTSTSSRNNIQNSIVIPGIESLCRQKKNPELAGNSLALGKCDWTCPDGFTPFGGQGDDYLVAKSVALYATPTMSLKVESLLASELGLNSNDLSMSSSSSSQPQQEQQQLQWCYDFQSPVACLKDKTLIFFGDSHIRNLAQVLCRMLLRFFKENDKWYKKGLCGDLDEHFDSRLSVAHLPRSNCTIAYLRIRYKLEPQLKNRFFPNYLEKFPELYQDPDFVIYGRNLWDIVFVDRSRREVMEEFESDMNFLTSQVFGTNKKKKIKYIIKAPHYTHYKHKDGVKSCSHWKRQIEQRDAIICGLSNFVSKQKERNVANSSSSSATLRLGDSLSIFDVFGASRQVKVLNGTDTHGHHYEGTIAESMTQQLLSIICPNPTTSSTIFSEKNKKNKENYLKFMESSFLETAKLSCDRIAKLPIQHEKIESCACGDVEAVKSQEAKDHCAEMKAKGINAPWIFDE